MNSLQVAEFVETFGFFFPEFLKPLVAITSVCLLICFFKKVIR